MEKRQSYFNPFTFFLILMGAYVLSNNYFKSSAKKIEPGAQVLQYMKSEEAKTKYIGTISRVNKANTIFQKNGNVVAMIAVPFISFLHGYFSEGVI